MKNHKTTLIEGTFRPEKARTIITELVNQKINFHNLTKFSNEVRFGIDRENSENRARELQLAKNKFVEWLEALDTNDRIKIHCDIHFEVIE